LCDGRDGIIISMSIDETLEPPIKKRLGRPPKSEGPRPPKLPKGPRGVKTPLMEKDAKLPKEFRKRRGPSVGSRPGIFAQAQPTKREVGRAIYEARPGATCQMVGEELGVPLSTVRRWKSEGGWKPNGLQSMAGLSRQAAELANKLKVKMSELGKPMSDEVALKEAGQELAEGHVVDVRAAVLDRHRKEWSAPRKIAYEAMQSGDFDRAKLAKISSETLQLIQMGECRAYGMNHDARGADKVGGFVLIDRDGAETPLDE
jgi:transposase